MKTLAVQEMKMIEGGEGVAPDGYEWKYISHGSFLRKPVLVKIGSAYPPIVAPYQ